MSKRKLRAYWRNIDWDYKLVQAGLILIVANLIMVVLNWKQMEIINSLLG